jgi:hypothetical protein
MMSLIRKNSIRDYRSTDPLIATSIYGKIISRDRFLQILSALHFNDNDTADKNNKLYKLSPVLDFLQQRFRSIFRPFQDLCIDESLVLWKGRLSFR